MIPPTAGTGQAGISLPDPVPAHPLLDGLSEIGRGEYSIVLAAGDDEQARLYAVVVTGMLDVFGIHPSAPEWAGEKSDGDLKPVVDGLVGALLKHLTAHKGHAA